MILARKWSTWQTAMTDRSINSRAPTSCRSIPSGSATADNIRLDRETGRVVVGHGDGALALVETASGSPMTEIQLPGQPEPFQLEYGGPRIFVNVPDAHQITVVVRSAGRQLASWGVTYAWANRPMGRLLTVYREPALLAAFDTRSGAPVARLPACRAP